MLLYNVTYPHTRQQDKEVSWPYLELVAKDRKNSGAKAECQNGEHITYVLAYGEWRPVKE